MKQKAKDSFQAVKLSSDDWYWVKRLLELWREDFIAVAKACTRPDEEKERHENFGSAMDLDRIIKEMERQL
jgi:hypothetical protein